MSRILQTLFPTRRPRPRPPSPPYYFQFFHTTHPVYKRLVPLIPKFKNSQQATQQPYERRIETARIKGLLSTIDRYATSGNDDAIKNYLQRKLNTEEFHNPSRSLAYENIITSLLTHNLLELALQLYERMISENIIPSLFTRMKMEALAIVHSNKSRKEVYQSLKHLFAEDAYDDASLGEMVDTLREGVGAHYPPQTIDKIAKLFIELQGPGYKPPIKLVCQLIDVLVRNQSSEHTEEWLDLMKELESNPLDDSGEEHQSKSASSTPASAPAYTVFLNALADTNPDDIPAQLAILHRMQQEGLSPDTTIFNNLIATQLRRQNLDAAFNIYFSLLQQLLPDPKIQKEATLLKPTSTPNAVTFRYLFKAIKLAYLPRGVRSRRVKWSRTAMSPRQLFGDMVECHLIQTHGNATQPSLVIDGATLHLALRTFMLMGDYAAALVVMNSLKVYGQSTNLTTYQIVIKGLLQRMHRELGSARSVKEWRWVDLLLGRNEGGGLILGMTTDTVLQLVRFGLESRITLDVMPENEHLGDEDKTLSEMPSLALIMGQEIPTEDITYSPVPLQRILRRALLAHISISRIGDDSPDSMKGLDLTPAQMISRMVTDAKQTMIRETPEWVKKVKRRPEDKRQHRSSLYVRAT